MKITAAPQVFDCLLKVAKSNLYFSDVSKNLFARVTLLYDAYYVGYAWRAMFEIIHSVVLSDRSQNVLQRGCAASPRVRDTHTSNK